MRLLRALLVLIGTVCWMGFWACLALAGWIVHPDDE